MGFKFPFSTLHELNLDWILEQVKKFSELIPPMETAVEDVQTALDDATEAVEKSEQALEDATQALDTAEEAKEIAEQAAQGTIADGAVTTVKLADEAVTTPKIDDNAVTINKLDDSIIWTLKSINPATRNVIAIGDSYGLDTGAYTGWITALTNLGICTVYPSAVGGSGFIGDISVDNFLTQVTNLSIPAGDETITDIIVCGGYNDASTAQTEANLHTAVNNFTSYCKNRFVNAKIHFGFIGADYNNNGMQATLNNYAAVFKRICELSKIKFIYNAQFILLNKDMIHIDPTDPGSGFHPNTNGNAQIALKLGEYLASGKFDVKYGFSYQNFQCYVLNGQVNAFPSTYVFNSILPPATYPFNTWTTLADLTNTATNLLWGTHDSMTCFAFWAPVYEGGVLKTHALFRILDKQIQINPLNSTSGLTLTTPGWICPNPIVAPFESMYG